LVVCGLGRDVGAAWLVKANARGASKDSKSLHERFTEPPRNILAILDHKRSGKSRRNLFER